MSLINPINPSHPEELLEAYALDALDDDETAEVESHLGLCAQCSRFLAVFQQALAHLGWEVNQATPPVSLLPLIMQDLPSNSFLPSGVGPTTPATVRRFSSAKLVLPLAAALVLGLFSVSMVMNLHASGRMDQLEEAGTAVAIQLDQTMAETKRMEEENAILAERLNKLPPDGNELIEAVNQLQAASYLVARPDTMPMILEPPNGTGDSNGVLLVGDGGSRAVLMISDMDQPRLRQPYDVWLVRKGRRVPVGQVSVDSAGWGSMMLIPPEPVFQFEWVNLTMKDSSGLSPATETMVLRSKIPPADGGK